MELSCHTFAPSVQNRRKIPCSHSSIWVSQSSVTYLGNGVVAVPLHLLRPNLRRGCFRAGQGRLSLAALDSLEDHLLVAYSRGSLSHYQNCRQ